MSKGSQTAGDISDYVMFSFIPLTFVFDAIDVWVSKPHDGWRGFGVDLLILLETMSVTLNINGLVAMVVRRPRPYVYDESDSDDFRTEGEAAMSFYSGHTSVVFALATAYSRLFMLRHPESPLIVPMWIFTHGAAGAVGALRVLSSAHFLTDVIVGAISGVGFGLLIPWLHELPSDERMSSHPKKASIQVRPYFSGMSAGLVGSFH
ncbi:MAG: phosphatase PAP2 family protein [Proteobacteria bacterium]|nr:phosphatase PAP2 family protein [Pseudomonadota bacterium]